MLVQLATALSSKNSNFLGHSCKFTKVLYFSNETNRMEIQRRLKLLNYPCENLYLDFSKDLNLNDIEGEIIKYNNKNENMLVIIDNYLGVNYENKFNTRSETEIINKYIELSKKYNINFILTDFLEILRSFIEDSIFPVLTENINIMTLNTDDDKEYQLSISSKYGYKNSIDLKRDKKGYFELLNIDENYEENEELVIGLDEFVKALLFKEASTLEKMDNKN